MKKILAILLLFVIMLFLVACDEEVVLDEVKAYDVSSNIESMKIRVSAAELTIIEGDGFAVESNLKNLTVKDSNGVLSVTEETKLSVAYSGAVLTVTVPAGTEFDDVSITTGSAKMSADSIRADTVTLRLGAGDVKLGTLSANSKATVQGGAGKITICDGSLKNLKLSMGVGELSMVAALIDESKLTLGVGKTDITLLGTEEDYDVSIEKGIGSISVNGETVSDFDGIGTGENEVNIEGGVGAINVNFKAS